MFDLITQHEFSQSRRKSIVEEFYDSDSNDNVSRNKIRFLWSRTSRRNKYKSISIHENILKIIKSYLIVWMIIDRENSDYWITWFEIRKMWLNTQMKRIWIDLIHRMRRRESVWDFNVHEILMLAETRKIRHFRNSITALNDFRCTMSSMIDESRSYK